MNGNLKLMKHCLNRESAENEVSTLFFLIFKNTTKNLGV